MAFTKVAPAGIGSTPGDGYRIGDSFLHSTGVEITNINATGIVTAASLDISGAIDFDGHTELDNVNISGVSTFAGNIDANGDLDVDGHTNLDNVSVSGVTTITGTLLDLNSNSANPAIFKLRTNTNTCEIEGRKVGGENNLVLSSNNSTDHLVISSTSVDLPNDNQLLRIGANQELKIAQDGTHNVTYMQNVGPLQLQTDDLRLYNYATSDLYLRALTNAGVSLYYDYSTYSTAKLATTATGVTIDGTAVAGALDISGDIDVDGHTNLDNVSIAGVTTITGSSTSTLLIKASDTNGTPKLQLQDGLSRNNFIAVEGADNLVFAADEGNAGADSFMQFRVDGSERLRITSAGKVGINTASPRAVLDIEGHAENATLFLHSNDLNANLAFSDNTGGARILNYGGDLAFRTGANAHAFGTGDSEKLRIEDNGSVGIGTDDASWGLSGNGGLVVGSGTGSQAITIFSSGNGDISFGDSKTGTARYSGLIRYSHSDNTMRFRTATSERLRIESNGNVTIGTDNNPGNTLRYLDVYNNNTGSSAGSILRLLTTKSDGSSLVGLDIVKYKAGGAYIINNENVGADTGFIAFNTGSSGISPATHLRVAGNGEVVVSPRNGGASNNRTSIHFNNAAHSPFIAFKSNNVTEAAYITINESSGGANFNFQTKNTSGTLLSRLTLKHNGEIVTHQLAGNEKGYPLVMGTGTVANNTNMSGSINMHDINGVHTSGGNNYHIGGWVFLGNDQAAAPYPVRRFKIFAPNAFTNGTIVYQVWHDGDSNYYYGGLWEIRINLWTDGDIEGVSLRCVNGYRDDLRVFAYNDSNGIMVQPSSIWGRMFIRRFGYDDGGRNPGSSYCAVANNGALAIYNSSGTDDGTMPSGGVELYSFDGTSGSASSTHTGGYNIENSAYFDG